MPTSHALALRIALLAAVLAGSATFAASHPRYGGNATVVSVGTSVPTDPLLADSPSEAALLQLTSSTLCRDTAHGRTLELATAMARDASGSVTVTLAPDLKARAGTPVTALDVATAWARAFSERSPYRALFAPIRGGEAALRGAARGRTQLALPLAYPWPDLESSLCHPALAVTVPQGFGARSGIGPFSAAAPGALQASRAFPAGRPFLDRLKVDLSDERAANRQLGLGRAQLVLNAEAGVSGPMRYATYLLFRPGRVNAGFRSSVEASLDRANLVRLFVRGPAAPMPALLPDAPAPSLSPQAARPPTGPLTLLYDGGADSQRGVAERLALELHDRGYDVRLQGLSRADLRARWARGDYDLMLQAVLLPAENAPALAVALTVAGREDLLSAELPHLGAQPDAAARSALALQRATALTPEAPAIPLYVQGVRLRMANGVPAPPLDALGVPELADLSLAFPNQLAPTGGP